MIASPPRPRTAAQTILLAALQLTDSGLAEFSDSDLTIAAWDLDPIRFGLAGHERTHPDHKRVSAETMSRHKPLQRNGHIEWTRPNYLRLTPAGLDVARSLSKYIPPIDPPRSAHFYYRTLSVFVRRPEFLTWRRDPAQPSEWEHVLRFLGVLEAHAVVRLNEIRRACLEAIRWANASGYTAIQHYHGRQIHVNELAELLDFLRALEYRFPQLESK